MKKTFFLIIFIFSIFYATNLKKKIEDGFRKKNSQRKLLDNYTKALIFTPLAGLGTLGLVHVLDNYTGFGRRFFDHINSKTPTEKLTPGELKEVLLNLDDHNMVHNNLKIKEGNIQIMLNEEREKQNSINNIIEECEKELDNADIKFASNISDLRNNSLSLARKYKKLMDNYKYK